VEPVRQVLEQVDKEECHLTHSCLVDQVEEDLAVNHQLLRIHVRQKRFMLLS
jgi:hypothetical protein